MSETCNHDCGSCSEQCESRGIQKEPLNQLSSVGKVVAVVSGKGGVGKSLVTSLLAVLTARKGKETAIMDADITGPSVPKAFGIKGLAEGSEIGIYPKSSAKGTVRAMSLNLLVQDETTPVIWRGPVISGTVKQFWTDVIWGDVDYMFIDMPPGTGDVPLTVFQSLPVDGIIVVTSPQELVSMIVEKAVNMAQQMNVPIWGIVENYSYLECPDCGKKIEVFGHSNIEEVAHKHGLDVLAKIPMDPKLAGLMDNGEIEDFAGTFLDEAIEKILER